MLRIHIVAMEQRAHAAAVVVVVPWEECFDIAIGLTVNAMKPLAPFRRAGGEAAIHRQIIASERQPVPRAVKVQLAGWYSVRVLEVHQFALAQPLALYYDLV